MKHIARLVLLLVLLLAACAPQSAPSPTAAGPAPTRPSTSCPCLRVYAMPEAGVQMLVSAIDGAQRSIKLKMYLFSERTLIEALKRAAARKVDVRILMEQNPYGGGQTNQDVFSALKGTGVKWQWTDDNVYRFTHEKSLVLDDQTAYIMTHNFTHSAFTANREYGVIDNDPDDVAEILRVFEADWNHSKPDLSSARLVWSPVNARQRLLALIDAAQTSIDVEQEEMQDNELGNHLLAAAQRGVQVRIVSSPDDPINNDPNEPQRERLRKAGAQVRYLKDPFVHAKIYVVDGKRAFVGSVNNSTNSLNNNRELGIIFDEAAAVKVLVTTFEKDFAAGSKESFPVGRATVPAPSVSTPSAVSAVNWKDAANYFNRTVTVEGTVLDTYNSGKVVYLNIGPNQKTEFKVVIFPDDWPKFSAPPEQLYKGKTLRITGKVQEYQGAPEMIIRDPSAIVVVK